MRGMFVTQNGMFSYVSLEARDQQDDPLLAMPVTPRQGEDLRSPRPS